MLRALIKPMLERWGRQYDYNVDYMIKMDEGSPGTLMKIALLSPLSTHQKVAPVDAYFVAKVVSTAHYDCGPCLQLVCNMAKEAGVNNTTLLAALRDPATLPDDLKLVAEHTLAVVTQDQGQLLELQDKMERRFSAGAIAEIALAIALGGFYPTLKRGLGSTTSCEPVMAELGAELAAQGEAPATV